MAVLAVAAIAVVAVTSWVLDVAAKAPSLAACKPIEEGGNSILYAGDGSKLGVIASEEARTPVAIDRIPRSVQLATVAIEDQRFYQHGGVDPEGIVRAALKDLEAGKAVEGGSTITQQLVRNLCISHPARNLERKIVEAKLAIEYSKRHSKREILGQYLNTASYGTVEGSTAVGVQAASKIYFSKPVWKLTLAQAALLAGLPQAPTDYNPILNPRGALARRNEVLGKMAKLGYVSDARAAAAERRGLELNLSNGYFKHRQPYFFDYVENKLIAKYGVNTVRKGGLKVYTTIDPKLQGVGLEAMRSALPYSTDPSSALVSIDPRNGEIRAMVSSSNYDQQPVQPRRAGPPPAGVDLQGLRPDHGDEAGDRPLLDLLHVQTARPQPAQVGALDGAHRRRGLPGEDQPAAGDGHLRQHGVRPARPRRRARERGGDGEVDGDHDAPRRDPGRGDRRAAARRLAAGADRRLRDARLGRHPPQPGRDPQGRLPRRPRRPSPNRPNRGG